jgi:osmotically inducible lipoprotein OsmB
MRAAPLPDQPVDPPKIAQSISRQENEMTRSLIALALAGIALAGCGTTTGDRGLSGAGIGAATGAVVGAVVGAPLAGAAIGAGAGATVGVVTSPQQVDLGKPAWEQ